MTTIDRRTALARAIYEAWCPTETHLTFEEFSRLYPEQDAHYRAADEVIRKTRPDKVWVTVRDRIHPSHVVNEVGDYIFLDRIKGVRPSDSWVIGETRLRHTVTGVEGVFNGFTGSVRKYTIMHTVDSHHYQDYTELFVPAKRPNIGDPGFKWEVGMIAVDGNGIEFSIDKISNDRPYPVQYGTTRSWTIDGHYDKCNTRTLMNLTRVIQWPDGYRGTN